MKEIGYGLCTLSLLQCDELVSKREELWEEVLTYVPLPLEKPERMTVEPELTIAVDLPLKESMKLKLESLSTKMISFSCDLEACHDYSVVPKLGERGNIQMVEKHMQVFIQESFIVCVKIKNRKPSLPCLDLKSFWILTCSTFVFI